MRQSIKFLLGDEPRELGSFDPTMTVLDYLRLEEHRTGTKEGCAEGDCGACTIVVGSLEGDIIRYQAVNSCIQFLPTLDSRQLISVEDLPDPSGSLHPVQTAMVNENASQCGFCTPGFVMSLFALYREGAAAGEAPDIERINDTLAGNLCRCTGYGPIIEAARSMYGLADGPDHFERNSEATMVALQALQDDDTIHLTGPDGRQSFAPTTSDALAEILVVHPEATIIAGATDVGLWVTKAQRRLDPVIFLDRLGEMQQINESATTIEIGAAVTYTDAEQTIADHYPDFGEVIRRLGSPPVRNVGTIGGNIANGSPIGDSMPPLIAAGATLNLRRGGERRELPLEDFFIDYNKQDLKSGEFVETITLPKPAAGNRLCCYKISKRFDQDISAVLAAFNLSIRNGKVESVRLAFGGMAAVPKRAAAAEGALIGQAWTRPTVESAMTALEEDFTPIDDLRASAGYRMTVARNLLMKAFLETTEASAATRIIAPREAAHA
jgi:xanthine dehydrogenase small subunit